MHSSFWEGFLRGLGASVFEAFGRAGSGTYVKPLSAQEAIKKDREALLGDMQRVAGDMSRAVDKANEIVKKQYPNVIAFPGGWPRKGNWPQGKWPRRTMRKK
jgi:hypothetical protein